MLRANLTNMRSAFKEYDLNADGQVSKVELMAVMKKARQPIRHDEVDELMRRYDPEGNGSFDFAEFAEMLSSSSDKPQGGRGGR